MKKKNNLNYPKSAVMGVVSKGLKNKFETAVVNEPSVFEPLKFYCMAVIRNAKAKHYNVYYCISAAYHYISAGNH